MELARAQIREALLSAQSPAVMCSFGKDSLLLLALVREINPRVPVLWFQNGATNRAFARQVIRAWDLVVYGYQAADVYLLANSSDTALVQEFSFGEQRVPLITDLIDGDACSLTAFPLRTLQMFLPFDLLLVGYKDSDEHWLKGGVELFKPDTHFGRAKVIAPIRHLTDEQVRAAVADLNISFTEHDDKLALCTKCMTQTSDEVWCPARQKYIPVEQWDREVALYGFQRRFDLLKEN